MNCVCLSFQPVRLEYEQKKWRREINEVKIKDKRESSQKNVQKKKRRNKCLFLPLISSPITTTNSFWRRAREGRGHKQLQQFVRPLPIGRSQHLEKENVVLLRVVDSSDNISIPRRERTREREQKLIEIAPVDDARFAFQLVILATYLKKGDGASSTPVSCCFVFFFFKIKPVFFIPRKKNTKKNGGCPNITARVRNYSRRLQTFFTLFIPFRSKNDRLTIALCK